MFAKHTMSETAAGTSTDDITSTLSLLESDSPLPQNPVDFKEIERSLDETTQWVNSTVLRAVFTTDSLQSNVYQKAKHLVKALELVKRLAVRKNDTRWMQCSVCKGRISFSKENFWSKVQEEGHIEELWAEHLAGKPHSEVEMDQEDIETVTAAVATLQLDNRCNQQLLGSFEEVLQLEHLKYDETVMNFCYPKEVMREVYNIDRVPEFTQQHRGKGFTCITCRIGNIGTGKLKRIVHLICAFNSVWLSPVLYFKL